MLIGFGIMMVLISLSYLQDLQKLKQAPEAVWLFVCGVPTEDPATFPLLLASGVLSLVIAGALLLTDYLRARRQRV